jgi:elongation factor Ts
MAEITAGMVKELRECTGAGMMECKKALSESNGDMAAAVDILRTRGLAALAKKAGRATNEGAIAAWVSDDCKTGVLVEVNSETDFVGRNDTFLTFVSDLARHIGESAPTDVDGLKAQKHADRGITVEELMGELVGKLGENMGVARFERDVVDGTGAVASYIHGGGKIGILVEFAFNNADTASNEAFKTYSRDVAMQVAAAQPVAVSRDQVAADVVAHELEIYKAQAAESGKPEQIQEKIAQGRLDKYFKEVALLEQQFVKNPDVTVDQYSAEVSKSIGDDIRPVRFVRYVLGESAA